MPPSSCWIIWACWLTPTTPTAEVGSTRPSSSFWMRLLLSPGASRLQSFRAARPTRLRATAPPTGHLLKTRLCTRNTSRGSSHPSSSPVGGKRPCVGLATKSASLTCSRWTCGTPKMESLLMPRLSVSSTRKPSRAMDWRHWSPCHYPQKTMMMPPAYRLMR